MEIGLGGVGVTASRRSGTYPTKLVALLTGQSQSSGRLTSNQVYTPAGAGAQMFGNDYVLKTLADPVDSNSGQVDTVSSDSATGSVWPIVASRLLAADGSKPLIFVPCAKGGSSITQWQPGADHQNRATLYGSMVYRALQVGANINLCQIGTTDAINGMSKATFKSYFSTFAAAVYADLGVKTMLAKFNKPADAIALAGAPAIWDAIGELWVEDPNVIEGPDLSGVVSDDNYHYTTDLKGAWEAHQWLRRIQAFLGLVQAPATAYLDNVYEAGASDHWLFGSNSASLTGKVAGGALAAAGAAPSYNSDSLVTASSGRNGLLTPYDDSTDMSWWMVCKRPGADLSAPFGGTLGTGANPGGGSYNTGGTLIFARGDTNPDRIDANTRTSGTFASSTVNWPAGLDIGGWFFLGVREVTTSGTTTREVYIHGSGWTTSSGPKILSSPLRKHAFGNAYYVAASYYNGIEVAQAGVINRAATRAEIESVAARQVLLEALRGHAVFGA